MQRLIKNKALVDNEWQLVSADVTALTELPDGKIIVPLELWLQEKVDLKKRGSVAVWLDSDQPPELLDEDIESLELIAINFPVFSDGRGYSYARELREQLGFEGELRAIGDILLDQLFYLSRCGFDAFLLRQDQNADAALQSFEDFSSSYQAVLDQPLPLFRRR